MILCIHQEMQHLMQTELAPKLRRVNEIINSIIITSGRGSFVNFKFFLFFFDERPKWMDGYYNGHMAII